MGRKLPPVENYTLAVPNVPPEGGKEWIGTNGNWKKGYLIYRVGRWTDPITEISEKCVDARCTRCGADMKLDYVAGPQCGAFARAPFGFRIWEGGKFTDFISGGNLLCPECGASVEAVHIGALTRDHSEFRWWMTVSAIQVGAGIPASLCLSFWRTEKEFSKDGLSRMYTLPWEAYVFDAWGRTVRLTHWQAGMYGQYNLGFWRQNKRAQDVIRDVELVYGDIASVLPGTSCRESKLDLYMHSIVPFPAAYLHLWQKHPEAEAFLTSGGASLLEELIYLEKSKQVFTGYGGYNRQTFNNLFPEPQGVQWEKRRPSAMLGMNADEYRIAARRMSAKGLENWLIGKKIGMKLRLPEDMDALETFTGHELEELGKAGAEPTRALRYLKEQKKRYGQEGVADVTAQLLMDYWRMREPGEETWPQNLKRAHEQQILRKKFREQEQLRKLFTERYEHCKRFEFEADGLMVVAPKSESDLIKEGKILHHCVASYAERHAKGEITILFVRRTEAPEVPYYTLSFYEKSGQLCMNLGFKNCEETETITVFRKRWEAWRNAGCRRNRDGTPREKMEETA